MSADQDWTSETSRTTRTVRNSTMEVGANIYGLCRRFTPNSKGTWLDMGNYG